MLALPNDFQPAVLPAAATAAPAWWFAFAHDQLLVRPAVNGDRVELLVGLEWPLPEWPVVRSLYLGVLQEQSCYAVELATADPPPGWRFEGLRGLWTRLDEALLGVAGQALQLLEWDRSHQFCGRCGMPTQRSVTERSRRCAGCGLPAYPRLSPVVMVRVVQDERILLARAPRFAPGVYSVLAGFVEAGETLEQAMHREVAEEVGIQVKNLRYFASQSWPFPHSLMMAFTADYAGGELRVDGQEIVDAHWFARNELPGLPSPMSLAWELIHDYQSQKT